MKTTLTTAAARLAKMARAEGVVAVVILADEKSPAIEVISLEQWPAQALRSDSPAEVVHSLPPVIPAGFVPEPTQF